MGGHVTAAPAQSKAGKYDTEELDTTFHTGVVKGAVDDLTLLTDVSEKGIVLNTSERYFKDLIYTYIGPVLLSVNPFKRMPDVGPTYIKKYQGANAHDLPPHIYAVGDRMYRNMLDDGESQGVIISGESGAGKTEAAKLIMNHIASVSGSGGGAVETVKRIILETNPLLEAFGNAKTLRNNNSSRFGKYFEILFNRAGAPQGGLISNFLLEKSRVTGQLVGERNFHIFYQLLAGASADEKEAYRLEGPENYLYLSMSECFSVDTMDDVAEWSMVRNGMNLIGLQNETQQNVVQLLAGILYVGNISFAEGADGYAHVQEEYHLQVAAYLLGVKWEYLKSKLLSRKVVTGRGATAESYDVPMTNVQAYANRDALAKAVYSKIFDFIVESINLSLSGGKADLCLSVLDIYGFEIFEKNGFEQFCINYINEKLQQIFIELTLKMEQLEYQQEGIKWTPIQYFDNEIVCQLVEGKRPPGLLLLLDDVCKTMHNEDSGVDAKWVQKCQGAVQNQHFVARGKNFMIKHYAGNVDYDSDGFAEKNKDAITSDLTEVLETSQCPLLLRIFTDDIKVNNEIKAGARKTAKTAGTRIREQAAALVKKLKACEPHYVRCIKPNETKQPHDYDEPRVTHQVKYLGILENVRVRRAGFAYRGEFTRFLKRYKICHKSTQHYKGDSRRGCEQLVNAIGLPHGQVEFGKTKIFLKDPGTLFGMEDLRERTMNHFAGRIQRAWRLNNPHTRRIHEETVYFWAMMEYNFYGCGQDADFGVSRQWPEYQEHLANAAQIAHKVFRNWRAQCMVMSLSAPQQQAMRTKIVSYDLFAGKKRWPTNRTYVGDYLSSSGNVTKMAWNMASGALRAGTQDQNILFSDHVNKVNGKMKSQIRALIVTDRHILKADVKKYKQKKANVKLTDISRISMSRQSDTFVFLNMKAPERDIIVDVGCGVGNEDKLAEFVTMLYQNLLKQTGVQIPVVFDDSIQFNNTRKDKAAGQTVTVSFGAQTNPKVQERCQFKKLSAVTGQILIRN